MTNRRIEQYDAITGERLEGGALVYLPTRQKNAFNNWIAMDQDYGMDALIAANLSKRTMKVLLTLFKRLDFNNYIRINQSEEARHLGIRRQNFYAAMRQLITKGIVIPGPEGTYRLDPNFGWKGNAKDHRSALNERARQAGLTVHEGGKAGE